MGKDNRVFVLLVRPDQSSSLKRSEKTIQVTHTAREKGGEGLRGVKEKDR